jgi:hypothetical protein
MQPAGTTASGLLLLLPRYVCRKPCSQADICNTAELTEKGKYANMGPR